MCMPAVTLRAFLAGGSIFTAIQTVENFPFFADNTPADLDQMLSLTYGQRIMFSALSDIEINDAAKFIVKTSGDKWNKLISFNNSNIDLGAESSHNITGTEKRVGVKNDTTDNTNTVSAYDSNSLITDTGSNSVLNENTQDDINTTSTDAKISYKSAFDNLSLADKTNIISTVLKDVSNYLTISVY